LNVFLIDGLTRHRTSLAKARFYGLISMHHSHVDLLVCPETKTPLRLESIEAEGDYVRSGSLISAQGKRYPIRSFIPRFADDGYAESFTVEWEKHPDILHGSVSNYSGYRKRFTEETKWPGDLNGEIILEAGCGPGALTPFALETGATVVSFDLSNSVEKARERVGLNPRSLFVQASIFNLPFKSNTFDRTFCFGVVQHTPDPAAALRELSSVLRPGGSLAADSYIIPDEKLGGGHKLLRAKYRFRRLLSGLPPRTLHLVVRAYVALMFPLYLAIRDKPGGADFMRGLMIDDYRYRMTDMDEKFYREFAVLDIFDFLSPKFDIPQSVASFRDTFAKAGLEQIDVHTGWNGIEGRGVKLTSPKG
jgi:SAM-dependent methyltransferase